MRRFKNVPKAMRQERRWCTWRFVSKGEGKKPAKVPTPTVAQAERWLTFDEALASAPPAEAGGIGFMLGAGWGGIDLDNHCNDVGTLDALAIDVTQRVRTYTEYSPSGLGLKLFFKTAQSGHGVDHEKGIEVYTEGRFFTVTGDVVAGSCEVAEDVDLEYVLALTGEKVSDRGSAAGELHNLKGPVPAWDIERVRTELSDKVNVEDYEPWLQVGMALHHQGGGAVEWLELWDEWSSRSSKYAGLADLESRWDGFNHQKLTGKGAFTLRSLIKEHGLAAGGDSKLARAGAPDWVLPYVYVKWVDELYNSNTRMMETVTSFRAEHQFRMADWKNDKGSIPEVWKYANQYWAVPVVEQVTYRPGEPFIFKEGSVTYVNRWSQATYPVMPDGPFSEAAKTAIAVMLAHFAKLYPAEEERMHLLYWIAHHVQRPGVRVRWMPCLVGVQGSGKTYIARLCQAILGLENVQIIEATHLHSQFNEWAEGASMTWIDELRQLGTSPGQIYQAMLSLIANDTVNVNGKFKKLRSTKNTSSYAATTNARADAFALPPEDRRVFVIADAVTAEEAKKLDREGYFERLFDATLPEGGALRRYFMEMEIPADFRPDGRALETRAKQAMQVAQMPEEDYAFEEAIAQGVPGISQKLVIQKVLSEYFHAREIAVEGKRLNKFLVKHGFWVGTNQERWRFTFDKQQYVVCPHESYKGSRSDAEAWARVQLSGSEIADSL